MSCRHQSSAGFTLVELLIGASLSAAVLAAVLSSYIFLGRQLARLANQQTLETQARRTLAYFTQDVQLATAITGSPATNRMDLIVPTSTGATNTVTYYYNNTNSPVTVSVSPATVSMPGTALTRCVSDGSTVTSLTILSYISDGNAATADDLSFSYYDIGGIVYTTYTDYLKGIKQVAIAFSTQTGVAKSGTLTPVQRTTSGRTAFRNRPFLP